MRGIGELDNFLPAALHIDEKRDNRPSRAQGIIAIFKSLRYRATKKPLRRWRGSFVLFVSIFIYYIYILLLERGKLAQ